MKVKRFSILPRFCSFFGYLPLAFALALAVGSLGFAVLEVPTASAIPKPSGDVPADVMQNLVQGHRALRALDITRARSIAASIPKELLGTADARAFLGRLAFYEGDYDKANQQLEGITFMLPDGKKDDFPEYVQRVGDAVKGLSVKESPHFRLLYQADGPDRILAGYAIDTLEKAYQALGTELGHFPTDKVRIELYPDSRRFIQASGLKAEEIETTGTVALCIYNKLMVTTPRALALGYRWMDTLSHEFVHLLVGQRSHGTVPVWLQEGLAKFFEVRWRGGRGADMSPSSESLLAEALQADKLVPFERMSPSLAKLPSAEEAQLAFAQVQTVIEYVIAKKGLAGIHRLMDEMGSGKSDREAMEAVLGVSFGTFENEWKQFMRAKRLKVLPGIALLPTILKAQETADGKGEGEDKVADPFMARYKTLREYSRLGDLMRERGRFKAALIEYTRAQESTPVESPALSVKIAMTHLDGRNPAEARRILENTVERYPSFAPAYTTLGAADLELGDKAAALKSFSEANAINPFDPTVHQALSALYKAQGDAAQAEAERLVLEQLTRRG